MRLRLAGRGQEIDVHSPIFARPDGVAPISSTPIEGETMHACRCLGPWALRSTTDVARHAAKQGAQEIVLRETLAEVLAEPFRPAKPRETTGALSHLPHDACIIRNTLLGAQPGLLAFVAGQHLFLSGQGRGDIDEQA